MSINSSVEYLRPVINEKEPALKALVDAKLPIKCNNMTEYIKVNKVWSILEIKKGTYEISVLDIIPLICAWTDKPPHAMTILDIMIFADKATSDMLMLYVPTVISIKPFRNDDMMLKSLKTKGSSVYKPNDIK